MRTLLALFVLVLPVRGAEEMDRQGAMEVELQKLQGTWEGYTVEGRGEKPDQGHLHLRLSITRTTMSAIDLGRDKRDMGSGTFQIDPSRPVKLLDAQGIVLPGRRARKYPGIYELDGDTLKWCVNNRQQERPGEMRTFGGNYLLILQRQKPDQPQ